MSQQQQQKLSSNELKALHQAAFQPESPIECATVSFNRNGQSREIDRIYYHAPCTDGMCGAMVVRHTNKYLTTHGIVPQQEEEAGVITEADVRDKSILVIDQCLELEFLKRLLPIAKHIDIIDHHASTTKILASLVAWCRSTPATEALLSKLSYMLNVNGTQSGVGMVWHDRYPTRPLHWMFRYVQDHDLGHCRLPFSEEVCTALYKPKYQSFDVLRDEFPEFFFEQEALERLVALVHEGREEMVDRARRINLLLPTAQNASFKSSSSSKQQPDIAALKVKHARCDEFDIAATLCERLAAAPGIDVAIVTSHLAGGGSSGKIKVSLRSYKPEINLDTLASTIFPGGGGHPGKAGAGAILRDGRSLTDFVDFN